MGKVYLGNPPTLKSVAGRISLLLCFFAILVAYATTIEARRFLLRFLNQKLSNKNDLGKIISEAKPYTNRGAYEKSNIYNINDNDFEFSEWTRFEWKMVT